MDFQHFTFLVSRTVNNENVFNSLLLFLEVARVSVIFECVVDIEIFFFPSPLYGR